LLFHLTRSLDLSHHRHLKISTNIIIIFISILKIYNNFPLQAVEIYSYYIHTNGREYPSTLIHSNLLKRGLVIHNRDSQHTCLIEKSPSINLFSIFLFVQLSFTQRYLSTILPSHNYSAFYHLSTLSSILSKYHQDVVQPLHYFTSHHPPPLKLSHLSPGSSCTPS